MRFNLSFINFVCGYSDKHIINYVVHDICKNSIYKGNEPQNMNKTHLWPEKNTVIEEIAVIKFDSSEIELLLTQSGVSLSPELSKRKLKERTMDCQYY